MTSTILKIAAGVVIGVAGTLGGKALLRRTQRDLPERHDVPKNGATAPARPAEVSP